MKRLIHNKYQNQNRGSVLALVMLFFMVFTIIGITYFTLAGMEGESSIKYYHKTKAFIQAENALNLSLWRINHSNSALGSFTSDSLSAFYDSTLFTVKTCGKSGSSLCSLQISLTKDTPFHHIVSYQSQLDTQNYKVLHLNGHQITCFPYIPPINPILSYYRSIADYYYPSDQNFSGPMPDGIHFVDGDVNLRNGTTLNGTIVARGSVKAVGHVCINAQKVPTDTTRYYPAIVAGDTTKAEVDITGTPLLIVNGAVYSTGCVIFMGKHISGPIIAPKIVLKSGVVVSDEGDNKYYNLPPGFEMLTEVQSRMRMVEGSWRRVY